MTMNRATRLLALVFACLLAPAAVWCADKDPGGQGTLFPVGSNGTHCFDTQSAIVQKVCATYQINWKLWALMGEPVGNYTLSWTLTSIQFRDQRKRGDRLWFSPDSLPPELRKAAGLIELYIDGHVSVNVKGLQTIDMLGLRHRFNTGVAVRPGAQRSFNVPGSPSWDDVFGYYDLCKPNGSRQQKVDAKTAQKAFKQGIYSLQDLVLCPDSGVSELTLLEDAVDKLCSKPGAAARFVFCQKQEEKDKKDEAKQDKEAVANKLKNKAEEASASGLGASVLDGADKRSSDSIHDLLDESTERTAIRKKLAQETASYRRTAEAACQGILRDIDACFVRAQCPRPQVPSGLSESECKTASGGSGVYNALVLYSSDCDEKCREESHRRREEERRQEARAWHEKWDPIKARCEPYYAQQKRYSQCEKEFHQACNPKNMNTLDDCVNEQVRSKGPTEKDARKLMQKEWDQRSKTGSSITNSILD